MREEPKKYVVFHDVPGLYGTKTTIESLSLYKSKREALVALQSIVDERIASLCDSDEGDMCRSDFEVEFDESELSVSISDGEYVDDQFYVGSIETKSHDEDEIADAVKSLRELENNGVDDDEDSDEDDDSDEEEVEAEVEEVEEMVAEGEKTNKYAVVDLTASGASSVSFLADVPAGGWTDEYKTNKLVFRWVPAGTFTMGSDYEDDNPPHSVTLTRGYWMGVFEVTQKQWELVYGDFPEEQNRGKGDTNPCYYVSYNDIRGVSAGSCWPSSSSVDAESFLGKLRSRIGFDGFDLPTEAQWECACRAGTETMYSYGDEADGEYMWFDENSEDTTHPVGTRKPNPWGLYDMHGNVWEWCLDWYDEELSSQTDPKGHSSGSYRVYRGGSWYNFADYCTASYRGNYNPSDRDYHLGFRLACSSGLGE